MKILMTITNRRFDVDRMLMRDAVSVSVVGWQHNKSAIAIDD